MEKQAGTELCQSRVMLEVIVKVVVKVRIKAVIKIGIQLLLWLGGVWWVENWRVMLISTKIVVEVEVEISNKKLYGKYKWCMESK